METSKKYIKMCEKAEEIQKEWKPNAGDWFLDKSTLPLEIEIFEGWYVLREDEFIQRVGPADNYDFFDKGKIEIWLPRQDQLQEIYIGQNEDTLDRMLLSLGSFTNKTYIDHWKPWHFFDSMEQLWLGFVMKEKYKKTWDGEKWINRG